MKGKHSVHKQMKFGKLPGDKGLSAKIAMLEGKPHPADEKCAKSFKKDFVKRANKRMRRKPIAVDE